MKNVLCAIFALSLLTACSSPVLKWIDTPEESGGNESGDKAILSFSFNIEGEIVLPIGSVPDSSGKIPISVTLPAETQVNLLTPSIEFIGKSLNPPPGRSADFSAARPYVVTARDGSTKEYLVTVNVKNDTSKAILRFVIDLPSALVAEGIIDEEAGTIVIEVPAGTDLSSISARIVHSGAFLTDPNKGSHELANVTFRGDFSASAEWTATAQDGTKKIYTVTVNKRKSSDKEIMAFSLGLGESVIIGSEPQPDGKYPILAVVPVAAGNLEDLTPALVYKGSFISPGEKTPGNFRNPANPVVYTVTAEDRSSRDYVIRVVLKEPSGSLVKQITGFYFTDPLIEGVINEDTQTIAITVPQGTNLTIQRPEIYYAGASVSPMPGQPVDFSAATAGTTSAPVEYTVRDKDGNPKTYEVTVFTVAAQTPPVITIPDSGNEKVDIGIDAGGIDTGGGGGSGSDSGSGDYTAVVEMPIHIENPVININYPGAGNTVNITSIDRSKNTNLSLDVSLENNYLKIINNDVFNYVPILLDNGEYLYVLAVNPPSGGEPVPAPADPDYDAWQAAASIDAFYFASPVAIGTIDQTTGAIEVTVPYGTDPRNLAAAICYTGKEIVGIPGANPLKAGARSFASPVDYTVKAHDDVTTKTYQVRVTVAPNTAKDITAFGFSGLDTDTIIGGAPNVEGKYPILITVPDGQTLNNLIPVITHTGFSIGNPDWSGSSGTQIAGVTDFRNSETTPVEYTVQDWVTPSAGSKTYAVTVRNADTGGDSIEITGFYFKDPLAAGIINENDNTIAVIVPSTTNTTNLVPTVYFKGMTINPGSDRANNFNGPVIYTVTGINGKTRSYTVTVTKTPSSSKDLTSFDFPGVAGSETVIGAVPGPDGSYPVSVFVPAGTDLGNLSPDIVYSGISIGPESGAPQDFNGPQTYTITAEDGSTKTYTVTTTPLSGDSKLITSLAFNEVPLDEGLPGAKRTIRVVAAIDQESRVITATVPHTADTSGLAPTITYIGKSIAGPGGGDQTANPFTDVARSFGGTQTYTVKDQSGAAQPYTVRVLRQSAATVTFEGNMDRTVIGSNVFEQTNGRIIITAKNDADGVDPPYEWYVDGVKQAVSTTETTFILNVGTGDFTPGRHEIMLSGIKGGLHYTGRVYFTVAGGSK